MRLTARALLTALVFTGSAAHALTCSPPERQDLVGLWESRETSKGGIGHTVEFRPDGSYVEAPTVIVNTTYQLSGDKLILEEIPETRIEVRGDTLIQTRPDGSTVKKKRVGKAAGDGPALIGSWRYRHDTRVTAYERYTPDGRMQFRLPMTSTSACYKVAGDRLSLQRSGRKETFLSLEVKPGELVLRQPGKPPALYDRAEGGAWYGRENRK